MLILQFLYFPLTSRYFILRQMSRWARVSCLQGRKPSVMLIARYGNDAKPRQYVLPNLSRNEGKSIATLVAYCYFSGQACYFIGEFPLQVLSGNRRPRSIFE